MNKPKSVPKRAPGKSEGHSITHVADLKRKYPSYWNAVESGVYQHLMILKNPEKLILVGNRKPKWTSLEFKVHPQLLKTIAYNAAFAATGEYHARVGNQKKRLRHIHQ